MLSGGGGPDIPGGGEGALAKFLVMPMPMKHGYFFKVPIEEREFLKDERKTDGTRGRFQIGPVDAQAQRTERRRKKRKQ